LVELVVHWLCDWMVVCSILAENEIDIFIFVNLWPECERVGKPYRGREVRGEFLLFSLRRLGERCWCWAKEDLVQARWARLSEASQVSHGSTLAQARKLSLSETAWSLKLRFLAQASLVHFCFFCGRYWCAFEANMD